LQVKTAIFKLFVKILSSYNTSIKADAILEIENAVYVFFKYEKHHTA